jgi:hypothetical protein
MEKLWAEKLRRGCAIPTEEQAFEGSALCDKKPFYRLDFLLLFYQENGEALLSPLKNKYTAKKSSSLSGNERWKR